MSEIILKPGREKSLRRCHPWVFSGAVDQVKGNPEVGGIVKVISSDGQFLGMGSYNPHSSIRIRMWTFNEEEINSKFIYERLRIAIYLRNEILKISSKTCYRLVNAESDGVPGLIVDRYEKYLVAQFLTAGIEVWKDVVVRHLQDLTGINNIYERSDVNVREIEGLSQQKGVLAGSVPPKTMTIEENGLAFNVDIVGGQKTGFYLDQRENRKIIRKYVHEKNVLNCFSYTGGFSINALAGGAAHVLSIDSSEDAIEIARQNSSLNGFSADRLEWICGDVFEELRTLRDRNLSFDVIIMDPPKFAPTAARVRAASRGYKDINLLAFKLLKTGGILITFSCSGGVSRVLFQKIVADAALDAGVDASILEFLSQSRDHPVALNFPEGEYLKGLVCRIK